jgi:hypothetical protein
MLLSMNRGGSAEEETDVHPERAMNLLQRED